MGGAGAGCITRFNEYIPLVAGPGGNDAEQSKAPVQFGSTRSPVS